MGYIPHNYIYMGMGYIPHNYIYMGMGCDITFVLSYLLTIIERLLCCEILLILPAIYLKARITKPNPSSMPTMVMTTFNPYVDFIPFKELQWSHMTSSYLDQLQIIPPHTRGFWSLKDQYFETYISFTISLII